MVIFWVVFDPFFDHFLTIFDHFFGLFLMIFDHFLYWSRSYSFYCAYVGFERSMGDLKRWKAIHMNLNRDLGDDRYRSLFGWFAR